MEEVQKNNSTKESQRQSTKERERKYVKMKKCETGTDARMDQYTGRGADKCTQ
jgi:hypothetical protein